MHFGWQLATLDIHAPDNCLARFKSNAQVGWLMLSALLLDMTLRGGAAAG
jgi:4-hydroxybenzoate polyprenyltransferase